MKGIFVLLMVLSLVVLTLPALAAGTETAQQMAPAQQPAKSKVKQEVIFCPTVAVQAGPFIVDSVDCEARCRDKSKDFTCKIRDYLSKGWKVQASVNKDVMANGDAPCTCRITGTEYIVELEVSASK